MIAERQGGEAMGQLSPAEVSALRDEIQSDIKQSIDLTNFAITASMAVVGYGLGQRNEVVVLLPLAILAAARRELTNRRANVLRIATYLKVFAGDAFRYEERLWHWRQLHRRSPVKGWSANQLGTFQMLTYAGHLCAVAAGIVLISEHVATLAEATWSSVAAAGAVLRAGIVVAAIIGWQWLTIVEGRRIQRVVAHGKMEEDFLNRWRTVGDGEAGVAAVERRA